MSVSSEISRIKRNLYLSYTAVREMGGTRPGLQNSENLKNAIRSIPRGKILRWNSGTMPSSADWYSVAYGNEMFVSVAYNSNKAAYGSPMFVGGSDGNKIVGIVWFESTLPSSSGWYDVTYGGGKFVAVSSAQGSTTSSNKAAYSTDGDNWTAATLPSSAKWRSVTYGNGIFVAVAYGSSKAAYSTDGVNWTAATLPSSANWQSIAFDGNGFAAVASGSDVIAYSYDGEEWYEHHLPLAITWQSITGGPGTSYVAVPKGNQVSAYGDLNRSSHYTSCTSDSLNFMSVAYAHLGGFDCFVAVAAGTDKTDWGVPEIQKDVFPIST